MGLKRFICETCFGEVVQKDDSFVCLSCGNKYSETKNNLIDEIVDELNSANLKRKLAYFDEALEIYDDLLQYNDDLVEASFGALLSEYGIEYVKDYDGSYKPTCHRLNEVPVNKSRYYDNLTSEYKLKADKIEQVRLEVFNKSKEIEPYDVFICYKKTSLKDNTRETIESKWAEDIYNFLTYKAKLRVFYAEKSLSKSNVDYEPHIYAALRSAKIMLVLTTDLEHLQAPWVQNEWRRFASYIRNGEDKVIRVITDKNKVMPTKLPRELKLKQVIDHELSSWVEEVIKACLDVCKIENVEIVDNQQVINYNANFNSDSLFERINFLMEEKDINKANELLEIILNNEPRNAKAYFYKLLFELDCVNHNQLIEKEVNLLDYNNYNNAVRFADADYKVELLSYKTEIERRLILKKQKEILNSALLLMNKKKYFLAIDLLKEIRNYENANDYIIECENLIEKIYQDALSYFNASDLENAKILFLDIKNYKDAKDYIQQIDKLIAKEKNYQNALILGKNKEYKKAISMLLMDQDYKDSSELINQYRIEVDKKERFTKKVKTVSFSLCGTIVPILISLLFFVFIPNNTYNSAMVYMNNYQYEDAEPLFESLNGYNDSDKQLKMIEANKLLVNKDYDGAIDLITGIGGEVTIRYNPNGGTFYKNIITTKEKIIHGTPIKYGYHFDGWSLLNYTLESKTNSYSAIIYLEANWSNGNYSITYELNGGINNINNPSSYTYGQEIKIYNPTKENYVFAGWSLKNSSNAPVLDYVIRKEMGVDITLVAHWTEIKTKDNLKYYIINNEIFINEISTNDETLIINNTIEIDNQNYSVNSINFGALSKCDNLVNLTLPFIGENPDKDLNGHFGYIFGAPLADATQNDYIPSSLKNVIINGGNKIVSNSFINCSRLNKISLPNSVEYIGTNAFKNCLSLKNLELPFIGESGNSSTNAFLGYLFGATSYKTQNTYLPNGLTQVTVNGGTELYTGAFYGCKSIKSVDLPDNLNIIYEKAFYNCSSLNSLKIPNYVRQIGHDAFYNCTSLLNIFIPKSVTQMEANAFTSCDQIVIYCEASSQPNEWNSNWNSTNKTVIWGVSNDIQFIKDDVFHYTISDNKAIISRYIGNDKEIIIPLEVTIENETYPITSISSYAFKSCNTLEKVIIQNNITEISNGAFYNCTALKSITLPFVGQYSDGTGNAFLAHIFGARSYNSNNGLIPETLEEVILTDTDTIPDFSFYNCYYLRKIVIPNTVTTIGEKAFGYCNKLNDIQLPSTLKTIKSSAFKGCIKLKSIYIPSSVINIGESVFSNCSSLSIFCERGAKLYTWNNNWNADNRPVYFGVDTYLTDVENNNYIFSLINDYAVITKYLGNEINVIIPETTTIDGRVYNITAIGEKAFYDNQTINNIFIPNYISSIGNQALPVTIKFNCFCEVDSQPSEWSENWTINKEKVYWGVDNYIFEVKQNDLTYAIINDYAIITNSSATAKEIIIPEYIEIDGMKYPVTTIASYAFTSSKIETLYIPDTVTTIRKNAVTSMYSDLSIYCEPEYKLPNWYSSFTESDYPTYWGVSYLKSFIELDGFQYTLINDYAILRKYVGTDTNVNIPSSIEVDGITYDVKVIYGSAFYDCNKITSVYIPNSITEIGSNAFYNCTSLTRVVIPSSVTKIGTYLFSSSCEVSVFCEATSQPDGWNVNWNGEETVYWFDEWYYYDGIPTTKY